MLRSLRLPGVLTSAGVGLLIGTQALAQSVSSDSGTIHQLSREFSAAYVRGDAAAMAALYTLDAVIFPERSAAISGRQAIERYWTLGPGRRITRHQATPREIEVVNPGGTNALRDGSGRAQREDR